MSQVLLIPGIGRVTFAGALRLLQPYSPRLAANFMNPAGSLYTDASRTTQVTAVGNRIRSFTNFVTGQPHGAASSDAKSPLFARRPATGRRNLLTYSEDFGNAAWTKSTVSVVGSIITPTPGAMAYDNRIFQAVSAVAGSTYTVSVTAKGSGKITIAWHNLAGQVFDLTSEYQTFSITYTELSTTTRNTNIYAGNITFSTGAVVSTNAIDVLRVQTELGSTATNYQKVVTSADITEAGVRDVYGALFDAADDCLQVSGFDLSDTDEVCVIAGVRKLSDAATATIVEHSANSGSTDGAFGLFGPTSSGSDSYRFSSRGTLPQVAGTGVFAAAPDSAVLVGVGDISGDISRLIRNNSVVTTNTANQGSGNYINSTLNIGMRNNATLPFNGAVSFLFILGAIPPDSVLTRIYRGLAPQIGVSV